MKFYPCLRILTIRSQRFHLNGHHHGPRDPLVSVSILLCCSWDPCNNICSSFICRSFSLICSINIVVISSWVFCRVSSGWFSLSFALKLRLSRRPSLSISSSSSLYMGGDPDKTALITPFFIRRLIVFSDTPRLDAASPIVIVMSTSRFRLVP